MLELFQAVIEIADAVLAENGIYYAEARKPEALYYYEEIDVKRFIVDDGACDLCEDAGDEGWVEDDAVYEGVFGPEDGPPLHPHCFLGDTTVSAAGVSASTKRWYEGEICTLRCCGVNDLSLTPNHPILTDRGWLPAGLLKPRDLVAQCISPSVAVFLINPNDNYVEAAIEDVSRALLMAGGMPSRSVPVSPEHFHGDGCVNSKVEVVRSARTLEHDCIVSESRQSMAAQFAEDFALMLCERQRVALSMNSPLAQFSERSSHSPNSVMGRSRLGTPLLRSHEGSGHASSLAGASLLEASSSPSAYNATATDPEFAGQLKDALSELVQFVKVEEVYRREFSGHVFNLETSTGFYLANTIIAHNCGCTLEYGTKRKRVYY